LFNFSWFHTAIFVISWVSNTAFSDDIVQSEASVESQSLDLEMLDILTEFHDVDDELFDLFLFHGRQDVQKENENLKEEEQEARREVNDE